MTNASDDQMYFTEEANPKFIQKLPKTRIDCAQRDLIECRSMNFASFIF